MPLPGFYHQDGTAYFLTSNRNGLRAPNYQRTDLRLDHSAVMSPQPMVIAVDRDDADSHVVP